MSNTKNITAEELELKFGDHAYNAIDYALLNKKRNISKPSKPHLNSKHTSDEAIKYADLLVQYEKDYIIFKEEYAIIQEYNNAIEDEIVKYILNIALSSVPEQYKQKVYSRAYSDGHSDGYYEVYLKCCNLNEIFQ